MRQENKKGQLSGLGMAVLALVVAAFVLVLGLQLLNGFQSVTDDYTATAVNESGAFINVTGYTLARSSIVPGFSSPVIVTAINGSNGAVIPASDYVLVGNVLTNATAKIWQAVNVTYSYNYGQQAYIASNKSVAGNATFADFWGIIVLAIVIGIVVTLLVSTMSSRKVQ